MIGLRSLISRITHTRAILNRIQIPVLIQKHKQHHEGNPQPFDNMPFEPPNRYFATVFFSIFFGIGLWSPFAILWYMMAKKTL
ncbi:hypothetical protein O3G_MSEX002707 [Manduca sexta]|uniref:Cytochrome c oxidase polypeptide VIIc n=1 Tax=Manduca sexta TaxID=7130 RepID=A0A922CED8_MANSE|nr:hypothetical protein O3G_MSEX002707 [Manduca sexta]